MLWQSYRRASLRFVDGRRSSKESQQESEKVTCMEEMTDDEGATVRFTALCCTDSKETYQPTNKQALFQLSQEGRNFQPQWYKQFPWLTICMTSKKAYCLYSWYAVQHNILRKGIYPEWFFKLVTGGRQCRNLRPMSVHIHIRKR